MEIVNYWLCNCAKKTHKAIGSHRWWVIPFRCQRVRNRVFTLITTLGGHQKNLKSVFVKLWDVSLITLPILSTNMNSNRTRTYPILATSLGTLFYPICLFQFPQQDITRYSIAFHVLDGQVLWIVVGINWYTVLLHDTHIYPNSCNSRSRLPTMRYSAISFLNVSYCWWTRSSPQLLAMAGRFSGQW